MSPTEQTPPVAELVLPPSVISRADVARLVNELERVDAELTTKGIRQRVGGVEQPLPSVSSQCADFLKLNASISVHDAAERARLIARVHKLKDTAPVIHMTFAVEADGESLGQIAQWLRTAVHPQAVIAVGLQPGLVAGVYLRTTNRVLDLSLRGALKGARGVLEADLGALRERA